MTHTPSDVGLLQAPAHDPAPVPPLRRQSMIDAAIHALYRNDPEYSARIDKTNLTQTGGLVDFLFVVEDEAHGPDEVFDRLRWGATVVYITRNRRNLIGLADQYQKRGYAVLINGKVVREKRMGLRLPFISPGRYVFAARKLLLIRPREITERFTYQVELQESIDKPGEWVVLKQVPTIERVVARLQARFPSVALPELHRRAQKFTEKIFPLFLTREAAILRILERHLPPRYRDRVPHVIHMEQDHRGYVRKLWMNWLRNGGPVLSQLEFARQSAELLTALHDLADVIHLDLRLDNFVITENGVGFVDFGSSVRADENISGNPLLSTIFGELMRTSEIQRMLTSMKQSGSVTSHIINAAQHKVDKAVDLFYLAVQINYPVTTPDFRDLIAYDPSAPDAAKLKQLTDQILRPKDPANPTYRSARDMLEGIQRLTRKS